MKDLFEVAEERANREFRRMKRAEKKGRGASKSHKAKAKRSRQWLEALS